MSSSLDLNLLITKQVLDSLSSKNKNDDSMLALFKYQDTLRRREVLEKKKEEEEKKKKEKDKKPQPVLTYGEFFFYLCALSPFAGAAMFHIEKVLFTF